MSDRPKVVVIGGGMGGLTAAAYLAREGVDVELVEQHYRLGGCCTSFKRRQFLFDAAVHTVPGCTPGGILHDCFSELGVWDRISWLRSDPLDVVVSPHYCVPMWADQDRLLDELKGTFPQEIDRLAELIRFLNNFRLPDLARWGQATLRDLLDHYLRDDLAKSIFIPPLGNLGMSSRRGDAVTACSLWRESQLNGGYAPRGGFQRLADVLGERVIELGGTITLRQEASRIDVQGGRVTGVQTKAMLAKLGQDRYIATHDVVGAGAAPHMYFDLVGREHLPAELIDGFERAEYSISGNMVFLGLNTDIHRKLRYGGCHWYFEDPRLDEVDGWMEPDWIAQHMWDPKGPFYLAQPTSYDPDLAPPGKSILTVMMPALHRPREYWETRKDQLAEVALSRLESLIPDIRQHIEVKNVATPATVERYTRNTHGCWYGWAMTREQGRLRRQARRGPIQGLYLAGHWTWPGAGVINAVKSGQMTAKMVLRELKKRR